MISDLTYVKKLSLAFAITYTVAASFGNVQALGDKKTVGIKGEVGTTTTPEGNKELFVKESLVIPSNLGSKARDMATSTKDKLGYRWNQTKDKVNDVADKAGQKASDVAAVAVDTAIDAKEATKGYIAQLGDFTKSAGRTAVGLLIYPFVKVKEVTVNTIGNPYYDHPFATGLFLGLATGSFLTSYLNNRVNRQLVQNLSHEDVRKAFIADLVVKLNTTQANKDTLMGKIQAQGGARPEDEISRAALESDITMLESALAGALRSKRSTLDLIKTALSFEIPSIK